MAKYPLILSVTSSYLGNIMKNCPRIIPEPQNYLERCILVHGHLQGDISEGLSSVIFFCYQYHGFAIKHALFGIL